MSDNANIPIFPLPLVVLPQELRPLHIFEERYKEMISYCSQNDSPFGISLSREGKVWNTGCSVEIVRIVQEYIDGRSDILTIGRQRYRIIQAYQDLSYLRADVEFIEDVDEDVEPGLLDAAAERRRRLLGLLSEAMWSEEEQTMLSGSYALVHGIQMGVEQKQKLLENTSENQRLRELTRYFDEAIPTLLKHQESGRQARSNGHPKRLH